MLNGPPIAGVRVELDDGRAVVTDGMDTGYEFAVEPRYACVTGTRAGFDPVHQCRQVAPGQQTFNSLIMYPAGTGPIDAGVDAAPLDAAGDLDADPGGDAGSGDGGPGVDGDGGGCCSSGDGGGGGDPAASLVLAALFALRSVATRRRT
jgi:hypothetical protein